MSEAATTKPAAAATTATPAAPAAPTDVDTLTFEGTYKYCLPGIFLLPLVLER